MGPPSILATGEVHKWQLAFPQANGIKINELVWEMDLLLFHNF